MDLDNQEENIDRKVMAIKEDGEPWHWYHYILLVGSILAFLLIFFTDEYKAWMLAACGNLFIAFAEL